MTSASPLNRLLGKVKDLIPNSPRKEKEVENEKNEPQAKPVEKEEKGSSNCRHVFGYLANRPKSAPIPGECLTCRKLLECKNKSSLV